MKTLIAKTLIYSFSLSLILTSCSGSKQASTGQPTYDLLSQQTVDAVLWYNTSAERDYIYEQGYATASRMVEENLSRKRTNRPPAVVLDIDETVLDNSPYQVYLIKEGKSFEDRTWETWVNSSRAKVLPGAKKFINFCEERGVNVVFISNRDEKYKDATLRNLMEEGGINAIPDYVFLRTKESSKTDRRERINAEFEVVLYVGDNLMDFDDRFEDRSSNYGKDVVSGSIIEMLPMYYLFPNPMYGQWLGAFPYPKGATDYDKAQVKLNSMSISDSE